MGYFRELPNIQINNRLNKDLSNDEVTIVKNFFKRAKIRDDLLGLVAASENYTIVGDERPDQVAEKLYGDPELDWVILITNNITDIQSEWPLQGSSFNKFLNDKYGDNINDIHHYETIAILDDFKRQILPEGLLVDKAFYDAPEYETITENPPGITFPPITLPGTQAVINPVIVDGELVSVDIVEPGNGYDIKSTSVFLSLPPNTANASASSLITDFTVSFVAGLDGGDGYNVNPNVVFEDPPTSTVAIATCGLGTGSNSSKVDAILSLDGGIGYGLTAPSVQFSFPPNVFSEGFFVTNSINVIGDGLEGMYVRSDGSKIYTSSLFSSQLVREYDLTTPWNASTATFNDGLNISSEFSYTTGIELSPDGDYMFVVGAFGVNFKLASYSLSTPWDITSASLLNEIVIPTPAGIRFKSDGYFFYLLEADTSDSIIEYELTTPWDITTATTTGNTLNITTTTTENSVAGFTFFEDGSKIFVVGSDVRSILEFTLSTPWDITTASYGSQYFVGDKIASPVDVYVRSDRKDVLISGNNPANNNKLYQYRLTAVAEATTTVSNSSVDSVTIINSGFGYTEPPTITFDNPFTAVTATGISSITAGIVTTITITNPGFGYTTPPSITIDNAPVSRNAVFTFNVTNSGISTITIFDSGQNYVNSPTFSISAPADIVNTNVNDTYSQNNTTWRWNGTDWQEKVTEELQYFNPITSSIVRVSGKDSCVPVSNYDYEVKLNDKKRQILVLKREYISVIITELRNIMKYDKKSKDYISSTLKGTYNPNLTGV